jgi:hypothetical protein
MTLVIERSRAVRFFIGCLGDYRRSAFQIHQAIKPTSTQGISDQRPEDQQHQQHDQSGDVGALGQRL